MLWRGIIICHTFGIIINYGLNLNNDMNTKRSKVMIAEDDFASGGIIINRLEHYKKKFILVKDGLSAVERIRKDPDIQVVFMDIRLPGMDGIEAMKEIKRIRENRKKTEDKRLRRMFREGIDILRLFGVPAAVARRMTEKLIGSTLAKKKRERLNELLNKEN